eukprot:GFYU01004121.1.p1 GENE.GFYU01004121.1~~GFYU01004121.1.p1  ORF type:complete len:789 (-),score=304.22 GFYU01004121.1:39-2405(-)
MKFQTSLVVALLVGAVAVVVANVDTAENPTPWARTYLNIMEDDDTPNYQGCISDTAKSFKYCDTSYSTEARVADLMSHLTLDEKLGLIGPDPKYGSCSCINKAIDRLGLPRFMWLVETNTGVNSNCYAEGKCATTFVGPLGMGASFNKTSWRQKGDVISTEMRAFANSQWYRAIPDQPWGYYKIGFTGFGPNINNPRDPRFGRTSELPGEDPFHSGTYATNYVQGMQQKDSRGNYKMLAYLKHFTAYSRETNRGHDDYEISMYDFWDTYLPQYEMAMKEGGAMGVMCSYNAENGSPSCANDYILNKVLREKFDREDAIVMTDCGAVPNMRGAPVNAASDEEAVAYIINNGTDIEAGSTMFTDGTLKRAIAAGLSSEAVVDTAVRRALIQQMKAGRFDPMDSVEWTSITADSINSPEHQQIQHDAALQSFVLLKNDNNILPFTAGKNVAVVGPHASSTDGLLSDYYGDYVCYDKSQTIDKKNFTCITTIAQAVTNVNAGGKTTVAKGVDINSSDLSGVPAAMNAAREADVVVLAVGIDHNIEREGIDRDEISLPGMQEKFARAILSLKKPTVIVLVNGGPLAIDNLLDTPSAIVEAFYPSVHGAKALAETLFGQANKWGKMPLTVYPANYVNEQPMTNYDMSKAPGRTYRYYTGTPLFEFGDGLSYTTFKVTVDSNTLDWDHQTLSIDLDVANTGSMDGDEVVMIYHKVSDDIRHSVDHPVPLKRLVGFERVTVAKGATEKVSFTLRSDAFTLVDSKGDKQIYPGQHTFVVSQGSKREQEINVTVPKSS